MRKDFKYGILKVIGYLIIFAGIFGLFLPFFQGFLMIAVGLYLVSFTSPKLREKLRIHFGKDFKIIDILNKIDSAIERLIEKL